jgi:hypothetical protein
MNTDETQIKDVLKPREQREGGDGLEEDFASRSLAAFTRRNLRSICVSSMAKTIR